MLEGFYALLILVVLYCPSIFGLLYALLLRRAAKFHSRQFLWGTILHTLNALISPSILAYFIHLDMKTGGGSVATLLSLPAIPITWIIFFIAQKQLAKAVKRTP
jgi:hypothetical protein